MTKADGETSESVGLTDGNCGSMFTVDGFNRGAWPVAEADGEVGG